MVPLKSLNDSPYHLCNIGNHKVVTRHAIILSIVDVV